MCWVVGGGASVVSFGSGRSGPGEKGVPLS